jgi:hypothetical protein
MFHQPLANQPICRGQHRVDRARGKLASLLQQRYDAGEQFTLAARDFRSRGLG